MCRFLAYVGPPIIIDELLVKPVNSLINQSYDAEEMSEPLNGDGFGLGWYVKHIRPYPGLFRSITPAWNNQNLLYNTSLIQTDCVFAHVRAASEGTVNELNCHPFHYKEFLLMHNGGIEQFHKIKRALINLLNDKFYYWIKGQTDSEHVFALLLQNLDTLKEDSHPIPLEKIYKAFLQTITTVLQLMRKAGTQDEIVTLNMLITDGQAIYGTRFSSKPEIEIPTMYYAEGTRFAVRDGGSHMLSEPEKEKSAVLIVSEKLTLAEEGWIAIPPNSFIGVDVNKNIHLEPLILSDKNHRILP